METIALEDEGVRAEIEKLQLPKGAVIVCDPWIYGSYCHSGDLSNQARFGWS
jgi:hypothetical protein